MRHLPDRLQYNLVGVHFVAARESPSVATNRHNEFWGSCTTNRYRLNRRPLTTLMCGQKLTDSTIKECATYSRSTWLIILLVGLLPTIVCSMSPACANLDALLL